MLRDAARFERRRVALRMFGSARPGMTAKKRRGTELKLRIGRVRSQESFRGARRWAGGEEAGEDVTTSKKLLILDPYTK